MNDIPTNNMTLFQARFVQCLTLIGYSIRATDGYFSERYSLEGDKYVQTGNPFDKTSSGLFSPPGNQIHGIVIRESAIKTLKEHGIEPYFDWTGSHIGHGHDNYSDWKKRQKRAKRFKR